MHIPTLPLWAADTGFLLFFHSISCIFLKFVHPIYENDTSPFGKGGSRGIFQVDSLRNPPGPPFSKGGQGGILSIVVVISGHKSVR